VHVWIDGEYGRITLWFWQQLCFGASTKYLCQHDFLKLTVKDALLLDNFSLFMKKGESLNTRVLLLQLRKLTQEGSL
jgi:hypothetical protein